MFQVRTNPLTVDEGGQCSVGLEHVLLMDVDTMEEVLQVQLQKEPQHGVLQIADQPIKPGQGFSVQDLKSLKVRSDTLLYALIHFMWDFCGSSIT